MYIFRVVVIVIGVVVAAAAVAFKMVAVVMEETVVVAVAIVIADLVCCAYMHMYEYCWIRCTFALIFAHVKNISTHLRMRVCELLHYNTRKSWLIWA